MDLSLKRKWYEFDSAMLHVLAMLLMLSDHAWSTLFPSQRWMTSIGRIAFPIFAFMIAEGYSHTHDLKKYMQRMLVFALLSEIPFNLMMGGNILGPYHQNVMWTFLITIIGMKIMDTVGAKKKLPLTILADVLVVLISFILGEILFVDYFGPGVITVYLFHFFGGRKWWQRLGQFIGMYWLNVELLGGYCVFLELFGHRFEVVEQGIALFALLPIWLYKGRQGHHSKAFRYFCYGFYPAHMLLLVAIGYMVSRMVI